MTKFTVSETDFGPGLKDLIEKIFLIPNLPLTHLNISKCPIYKNFKFTEIPELVTKILETIDFDTLPNLISLNLSGNTDWWNNEDHWTHNYCQEYLFP